MNKRITRLRFIAIGAIGGFFAGLTFGQILGIFVGNLFDMFGIISSNGNELVIGGSIGLTCGAIIGGSFLFLGKTIFFTSDKPLWGILVSACIGLAIGIAFARDTPGLLAMKFSGLGQGIGISVGAIVGCFSGILVSIHGIKIQVPLTEEEKRQDDQYAQFLKDRAKRE